ncbi:MAG: NADH-quinone oxidoreductase subunit J [Deltaproteobacteria bacterium]|nr:NADH-quinone oxidoreductase subunit J [Deltaproteobacteria bacterium]
MTTISDFIPPIIVAQGAFWFMVVLTLAGALIAVTVPKILHNILGLALSMFGVAGIYLYLGSQFVAVMQLLIYVGAICITYVFAIMLSPPMEWDLPKKRKTKVIAALIVSVVAFIGLVQMVTSVNWGPGTNLTRDWSIKTLGQQLLTRYFLVFELISLLLAIAIIGAIMIASYHQKRD